MAKVGLAKVGFDLWRVLSDTWQDRGWGEKVPEGQDLAGFGVCGHNVARGAPDAGLG